VTDRALTVSEIIDQRPLSRFQISIIGFCGLVLVIDGFDTQCIGFHAPSIADTLGIPLRTFGPVFAAGLLGLMIAAMTAGPIADLWGRKWPIVLSTLTFATFALLTARAKSFDQLVVSRFLTGLGLGGAMPNVVAVTSEYAPRRLLPALVTTLFCGMPLGALLGGQVSSVMVPRWGWQSVFYVGGILPLAVSLVLIKSLPESPRFLSVRGSGHQKIARILARISPELATVPVDYLSTHGDRRKGMPIKHLFTEGRAKGTILLWVPYFMNLLILYFIVSWLPALLRESGLPVSAGITAVSLFSLGGIFASLAQGRLMNGCGTSVILVTEFGLCMLFIGSLAFVVSYPLKMAVTFLLGYCVQGAQAGLNALAASFYPTPIRSTGVGWALGIGRLGSIVGPMLGGVLLSMGWPPRQIFLAGAVPALCAMIAIILNNRLRDNSTAYHPEPDPELV
jgi:AAHS family 4-hydroxybenzoate transporter-like MFS transporter